MTYKTKFKLEARQGLTFEEQGVEFRIYNYSEKEKQIEVILERGNKKNGI